MSTIRGDILTRLAALEAASSDPFDTLVAVLANDVVTDANMVLNDLTGLVFTFAANSTYVFEFFGRTQGAASTTGSGFAINVSAAVTSVSLSFYHQLADATGTITGGSSISDAASSGITSGRPAANTDTPVSGDGVLVTGANTGTAQLQYRSEVNAVSTCKAGFVMRVHKVA